ncbi:MAG: tetratricopeptide repeat protein [Rhodomicrobium sp.]
MSKISISVLWFLTILSLQPAHADSYTDGRWSAMSAEIQVLKQKGDYKLAFLVLDHYIKQTVERLYPNDFLLAAAMRRHAYFGEMPGGRQAQLISLWNTISMDIEDLGRDDPVVAYDYATIGDAYAALNDFRQAEAYYSQAIKILTASFSSPDPVWGAINPKPSRAFAARERHFGAFNPPSGDVRAWIPPR